MLDTVVLEFDSELAMLEEAIVKRSLDDEMFDKVLDDIIECLYMKEVALENLDKYTRVSEVPGYHQNLLRTAEHLGQQLYSRFEQFGLYLQGVLPWQYSGRCGTRQLILSFVPVLQNGAIKDCELNRGR
ncbi:5'(3')-deoxyribonucleotidase [Paraburkholderia sp. HC6.4b]|uniref:hypothetical protein n=1 Tax=unclassified Paraburkholderia TaxID=2615204 RepID=UPI0016193C54|nr:MULTISPECIES: hypothetical protein [unclassified Paraburkholderia]MBB5409424.1 5'(3')-deoxyribonucleotidase [Paraburkholderia sp. HC6.4b]MBB5451154.1 5'(3')-deoxyribonucleotidase [Paraburkholderia sp. Kb1A]